MEKVKATQNLSDWIIYGKRELGDPKSKEKVQNLNMLKLTWWSLWSNEHLITHKDKWWEVQDHKYEMTQYTMSDEL